MTKRMRTNDYAPLLEKIRSRINTWTVRSLSFAGRLQLLRSVLLSITNFWSSEFRLHVQCLREIERVCATFLWSGPALSHTKEKIAWSVVTRPKEEGELGICSLKETNKVNGLKLLWRIAAGKNSLWVKWLNIFLIRKALLWSVKDSSNNGSWMWRKILKMRPIAKLYHRMEVHSGKDTSFWHDHWSPYGRLIDTLGDHGRVTLGIKINAIVEEVIKTHRRHGHRVVILNNVDEKIAQSRANYSPNVKDIAQWQYKPDVFKPIFESKATWCLIRETHAQVHWDKLVWFQNSTPKYSLLMWLSMHNRLATGDRVLKWNPSAESKCVFCNHLVETKQHMFFSCAYSKQIWQPLVSGILKRQFTNDWERIVDLLLDKNMNRSSFFLLRYVFQTTIYWIWRERNGRRHEEVAKPPMQLVKFIDKNV